MTQVQEGQTDQNQTDQNQEAQAKKTVIKPNTDKYVKTNGRLHTDDVIGHALAGLSLEQVQNVAGQFEINHAAYNHLNVGQQRMAIGNKLRGLLKKDENGENQERLVELTNNLKAENEKAAAAIKAEKEAEKAAKEAEKAEAA